MGVRGEGIIQAGNQEIRVLFTNRALGEFEQRTSKSIIGVLQGFARGESGVNDLAQLLRAGMEAAQRDARERQPVTKLAEAYEVLDEAGFATVAQVVMEAIGLVISYSGGEEPDSKNS